MHGKMVKVTLRKVYRIPGTVYLIRWSSNVHRHVVPGFHEGGIYGSENPGQRAIISNIRRDSSLTRFFAGSCRQIQVGDAVKHTGGCLCGAISFEVTGPFEGFFLCHCSRCRKDTGSSNAANLFSKVAELRWLSGESQVTIYNLPETRHVRSFCAVCGSALPSLQTNGTLLVPAGSLDTDVPLRPQGHIFMDSRANWDEKLEALPKYASFPA